MNPDDKKLVKNIQAALLSAVFESGNERVQSVANIWLEKVESEMQAIFGIDPLED